MLTLAPLAIMAAATTLFPSALATFDASANTNMAVYWGQGPSQKPLKFFCDDDKIDIIPIGFVNVFPDQSGGYPGTNFGNQCGSETYKNINGSPSLLLSNCPAIGPDITYCQSVGKKILLSLGGAIPNNQHLNSDVSAVEFATFLWEAFGPEDNSKTTPRPFGSAVVDGFDFDIENVLASGENAGDLNRGYGTMVNTLRSLYDTDKSKPYYVSAAPQCIVPDAHMADAIETSPFDFLFIQFYNTPQCSARAYFDHSYGGTNANISFASWVDFVQDKSYNPNTKVYLGLPAAPDTNVVYDLEMYLQPSEAKELIVALQCEYKYAFGGVMIYEATSSQNNQIQGQPYADVLKGYMKNSQCTVSPVTSSATVHSTSALSSTQAVTTASAVSTTRATSSITTLSSSAVTSSTQAVSSVGASSSSSPTTVVSSIPTSAGRTSTSISTTGSSMPAISTGSSAQTSSAGVVVSTSGTSSASISTSASSLPAVSSGLVISTSSGRTSASVSNSASYPPNIPTGSSTPTSSGGVVVPTSSGKASASTLTSSNSLPAVSIGSSTPVSSGGVVVSVTEVSTISRCPPNVSNCPFQSQTTASTAGSARVSVYTQGNGNYSSSSATAVTSSVPASTGQGRNATSVSLFTSASGSTPPPTGALGIRPSSYYTSVNGSRTVSGVSSSSGSYQNAASATKSSAAISIVTSSTPSPILSGTPVSPVKGSTEYTSLTTYTTVTSCPVTTTKIQGGMTSIIVETSLITSTVTTCPRCAEKTKSASVPGLSSSIPGSPGQVGASKPALVSSLSPSASLSSVPQSSPSLVPARQSSGPLPSPTTYTTTEIVSTLTTTCSEATTFSLSPSGKVYSATANETLTIFECPCTLTYKTTGYSAQTNVGSPSQPSGPVGNANGFVTGVAKTGTSSSSGATNTPSKSEAGESYNSPLAGSSSPPKESGSSTGNSNGSSSPASPGASNTVSQSKPNGGSEAASPSVGAPSVSNSGTQSKAIQQLSPEQSIGQGNPFEAGAPGSISTSVAPTLASGVAGAHPSVVTLEIIPVPQSPSQVAHSSNLASSVTGAHLPVVTMEIIPVPLSPSQVAQSGKANQSGPPGTQTSGQSTGYSNGQEIGPQSGQSGKQSGEQIGQQSGQQSNSVVLPVKNGTAPMSPSGTVSSRPSVTAPTSQGAGSGGPIQSSLTEFKGTGGRVGSSLFGVMAVSALILLL